MSLAFSVVLPLCLWLMMPVQLVVTGCTENVAEPIETPAADSWEPRLPLNNSFQRGVTYVPFKYDLLSEPSEYANVDHMLSTGADWVSLVPIWYQDNFRSTVIAPDGYASPTIESLREAIIYLHEHGKKVMLKPYVDSRDHTWRARFDPIDVAAWFSSYRDFMYLHADLAEELQVEMFCVGCEYMWSDETKYDKWSDTIAGIRSHYSGQLTYAADGSNYQRVCFWELVDFIGVDAYFSLYSGDSPKLRDLVKGWHVVLDRMESWVRSEHLDHKEIIFTEVGFEAQPNCWVSPGNTGSDLIDVKAQEICYKATFEALPQRDWVHGVYVWWWDNPTTHDAGGGAGDNGWTPKGKPAEQVLRDFYSSY